MSCQTVVMSPPDSETMLPNSIQQLVGRPSSGKHNVFASDRIPIRPFSEFRFRKRTHTIYGSDSRTVFETPWSLHQRVTVSSLRWNLSRARDDRSGHHLRH